MRPIWAICMKKRQKCSRIGEKNGSRNVALVPTTAGFRPTAGNTTLLWRQIMPAMAQAPATPMHARSLQSRTGSGWPGLKNTRHWSVQCSIQQHDTNVLELSKCTFQHQVKIQEPIPSLQVILSLEHNKEIHCSENMQGRRHYRHLARCVGLVDSARWATTKHFESNFKL